MKNVAIVLLLIGAYSAGIVTGIVIMEEEMEKIAAFVDPCDTGDQVEGCINRNITVPQAPPGGWQHLEDDGDA